MKTFHISMWVAVLLLISACGASTTGGVATTTSTTISGNAVAGAVNGTVSVLNTAGKVLTTATVSNGAFSVTIPNSALSGELIFEVTGTYTDEVSGNTVTLTAPNPLALRTAAAYFVAGAAGNAPITPDTTIINQLVVGGQTLTQATTTFQSVFGYAPDLSARPFDPYTTTITAQTQADKDAAFRVGLMSQLGSNLGLSAADLAEMPAKLAADLADGTFDGIAGGNPVTFISGVNLQVLNQSKPLANQLSMSVAQFSSSSKNAAGVVAPSMGLPPIKGDRPGFTKTVALTDGTQLNVMLDVVYAAPFQTGFRSTKTTHKITLTNTATNAPFDITAGGKVNRMMVMPLMYMNSGMNHTTPHSMVDTTQAAAGVYLVDMYYLMPSGMNNMPMGQWELTVQLGDTTSTNTMDPYARQYFYPNVMMNMGTDLLISKGSNILDTWTDMKGLTTPREYRVWLHDIYANAGGSHDLTVFISTRDMADMTMTMPMGGHGGMSFPPVYAGQTLHQALTGMTRPAKTVATVIVEASVDGGTTWNTMTSVKNMMMDTGKYQVIGLAGLTTGQAATVSIRVTVDGNVMLDAGGNNPQLSFTAL